MVIHPTKFGSNQAHHKRCPCKRPIQAADYTTRRRHSHRPEVNGAPEFLQHRCPEYKVTKQWVLKFWRGKGKTETLRVSTLRATEDGNEGLSVDGPKPPRTTLPLALIALFGVLLLTPLGTPEITEGLYMLLPFLVGSSSMQGAIWCEKET